MKYLFVGLNYSPELTGIGKYSGEMSNWLSSANDFQIKFITSLPYYPEWQVGDGYSSWRYITEHLNGVDVIRCPLFVPKKLTTLKRLIHLLTFAFSSFGALLSQLLWRPDVVVVVVPTLFCAPFVLLYTKLVGAKSVIHIQDYELDAMLGLDMAGVSKGGSLVRIARSVERFLFKRFDRVSTISYSMQRKAIEKGVAEDKLIFFPNWVDTDFITPEANRLRFRQQWGFSESDKIILYSGNVGAKQGLQLLLSVARHYQQDPSIQFVVVGQGGYRSTLEKMARDLKLSNFHFQDLVPYEDLPDLMAMADVHLVVQKRGAADVVLPSKLTSILSAGGHALITAESHTELGLLCEKYPGIATCVEPESIDSFIEGLDRVLAMDTSIPNKVARQYALDHLNKDAVLSAFSQKLVELCEAEAGSNSCKEEEKCV